jgi:hypothetical protein
MTKRKSEYDKFERTVAALLKVPHSEIKAKLEEEKKEKDIRKREKRKRPD